MKHRTLISAAVLAALVALGLAPAHLARASIGSACVHESQCQTNRDEHCVADSLTSASGHCQRFKLLP